VTRASACWAAALSLLFAPSVRAAVNSVPVNRLTVVSQQSYPGGVPARAVDATTALIDAFHSHSLVAISDPHGSRRLQALLLATLRDPRFEAVVDDVVMETLSARYQDVIDRYVRGDDVDRASLRHAWEDMTVPNSLGAQAEEMLTAIRDLNRASGARRLRVLAGDPPIDWAQITSHDDHVRWIELRDSYPADLIRRQVLDRVRKALIVYGQLLEHRWYLITY
jgi:hypothetical protein